MSNCPACGFPASHCQWWAEYNPPAPSINARPVQESD